MSGQHRLSKLGLLGELALDLLLVGVHLVREGSSSDAMAATA